MHKPTFDYLMEEEILPAITNTREEGQKEYAHDVKNIFANFERVSGTLSVKREKVLMTYFLKHIDGIMAHIDGHESQRESVYGRLTDAIVYLTLLWGMFRDEEVKNKKLEG
tara:strand:- start:360 stop:692 length:333 start_codon:yes stop_codon:yes gene_type:complete